MGSLAAKKVAEEVLETMQKGELPSVAKIGVKHGYTPASASSGLIQKTKTYQKHIEAVNKKAVAAFERERDRAIAAMPEKIKSARYRDLVDATDKFTKNHQLLTGQSTANVSMRGSIVMLPGSENGSTEPDK